MVVAGLCVQNGIAAYARDDLPQLALAVAPSDARALTTQAAQLLVTGTRLDDPRVVILARAAVARDATLGTPYRILGFAHEAEGDLSAADRLVGYAGKLSRRDLAVQLWLINRAVSRNDVPGALEHFDIALRTSDVAPTILFPILANAVSEPEVVRALAPRLATARWTQSFVSSAIDSGPSLSGMVMLAQAMNRQHTPFPPETIRQLANRMVETRTYTLLGQFRAITPARPAEGQAVSDPTFNHPVNVPSFDWVLGEDSLAIVARVSDGGQGSGMTFELAEATIGTQLARQLQTLAPGRYRLSITGASNIADAAQSPVWTVACAEATKQLALLEMPTGRVSTIRQIVFDVPQHNCAAQLLVLSTRPTSTIGGLSGKVARVTITPA